MLTNYTNEVGTFCSLRRNMRIPPVLIAFSNEYTCTIYNLKWYRQFFAIAYKWFDSPTIRSGSVLFFANQNRMLCKNLLALIAKILMDSLYFVSVSATLPPQRPWIPLTRPNRTRPTCKYPVYHAISFPKQIFTITAWVCSYCSFKH